MKTTASLVQQLKEEKRKLARLNDIKNNKISEVESHVRNQEERIEEIETAIRDKKFRQYFKVGDVVKIIAYQDYGYENDISPLDRDPGPCGIPAKIVDIKNAVALVELPNRKRLWRGQFGGKYSGIPPLLSDMMKEAKAKGDKQKCHNIQLDMNSAKKAQKIFQELEVL